MNDDGIIHVDYSHGSNESGADFVLARFDSLLNQTDYIGVIVKAGTIKQDNEDVRRQIRECTYERILKHTNTRGMLNTIWVITNMNITQNARKGFEQEFSNSKIKFLDQANLIQLIDNYYPTFWEEMPTGINIYFSTNSASCRQEDKSLNLIESDVYIEQDIVKNDYDKSKYDRKKVDITKEILSNQITIIEGGMGAGKSKLLRHLFLNFCNPTSYKDTKILPIRLSFTKFINIFCGQAELVIDELFSQNQSISLDDINIFVLLIDAIDEIHSEYAKQMEQFEASLSNLNTTYKDKPVKYVFTIREINFVAKYQFLKNYRKYYIKPLSGSKLFDFLCEICSSMTKNDRLVEDLKKSDLFKDIPSYPISAILLGKLINDGHNKDLPMNITELYLKYSELSLGRWDISKGLQGDEEFKITKKLMFIIAELFYEHNYDFLTIEGAQEIYNDYICKRNFQNINKETLFNTIIYRSGMFAITDNTLIFKHRTFVEFFYAQNLLEKRKRIFNFDIFSPSYHNITMFYIGLQNDCFELLNEIINIETTNNIEKFNKAYALSDYFLAGYATPYIIVLDNLHKLIIDIAQFYTDILNKKIVLPLSTFPNVPLLWLFQSLVRDRYAYSFFGEALDETCYNIEANTEIEEDVKIVALYFVCSIKLELGFIEPFDMLIEFHNSDLPLAVKYLITDEASDMKTQSKILKKLTNKVKDDMKKSNITYKNLTKLPIMPLEKVLDKIDKKTE